jgi:excinuclease ABC subunit B
MLAKRPLIGGSPCPISALMAELVIRRGLDEPDTTGDFVPHKPARPEKSMPGRPFELISQYSPAGDQPTAIEDLVGAVNEGEQTQVLLGVTGSGQDLHHGAR